MRRAQVSYEYLMIVAIAMLLVIPTLMLFYMYTQRSNDQVAAERLTAIGHEMVKQAQTVYLIGKDTRTRIEFSLPGRVESISLVGGTSDVNGTDIRFTFTTGSGSNELLFFTQIPLKLGNCIDHPDASSFFPFSSDFVANPGKRTLIIESCGDRVALYEP